MQEIGESRKAWGHAVMAEAENIANKMKDEKEPFYIVYACKQDKVKENLFRQCFHMYRIVPKGILGILVWYADNAKGIFEFKPELSSPPDKPIDPRFLSTDVKDFNPSVAKIGEELKIIH